MDLKEIVRIIFLACRSKNIDIRLTPSDFMRVWNINQIRHFKIKLGLPEDYQPGAPLPRQAYEITERISQDMNPFKVYLGLKYTSPPLVVNTKTGTTELPGDFYFPSRFNAIYVNNRKIRKSRYINILDDQQWGKSVGDAVLKGTFLDPIGNIQRVGNQKILLVQPEQISNVEVVYLRLPKPIVYNYTQERGFIEYVETGSVQCEWDDVNIVDIITLFLQDLSIDLKREDLYKYSESKKVTGK